MNTETIDLNKGREENIERFLSDPEKMDTLLTVPYTEPPIFASGRPLAHRIRQTVYLNMELKDTAYGQCVINMAPAHGITVLYAEENLLRKTAIFYAPKECGNCQFWDKDEEPTTLLTTFYGRCRRRAPIAAPPSERGTWPITSRIDRCGEHHKKSAEEPKTETEPPSPIPDHTAIRVDWISKLGIPDNFRMPIAGKVYSSETCENCETCERWTPPESGKLEGLCNKQGWYVRDKTGIWRKNDFPSRRPSEYCGEHSRKPAEEPKTKMLETPIAGKIYSSETCENC
jgi:hypothetical protein